MIRSLSALPDHPRHELSRQQKHGFGGMIIVALDTDLAAPPPLSPQGTVAPSPSLQEGTLTIIVRVMMETILVLRPSAAQFYRHGKRRIQ